MYVFLRFLRFFQNPKKHDFLRFFSVVAHVFPSSGHRCSFSAPTAITEFELKPLSGGIKHPTINGLNKNGEFRPKTPFISVTVRDRPNVAMAHE